MTDFPADNGAVKARACAAALASFFRREVLCLPNPDGDQACETFSRIVRNHQVKEMRDGVAALGADALCELRRLIEAHADALEKIKVPGKYYDIMQEVQDVWETKMERDPVIEAYLREWEKNAPSFIDMKSGEAKTEAFQPFKAARQALTPELRVQLDRGGLTYDASMAIMNKSVSFVFEGWAYSTRQLYASVPFSFKQYEPDVIAPLDEMAVQTGPDGRRFCKVSATAYAMADVRNLFHIARHEPEHVLQGAIGEMTEWTVPARLRGFYAEMADIFRTGGFASSRVYDKACDPAVRSAHYRTYRATPTERLAVDAGNLAELWVSCMTNVPPRAALCREIASNPELVARMGADQLARIGFSRSSKTRGLKPIANTL